MVKLFTVDEMIALEKEANAAGLTYNEMMQNAGSGIAEEILKSFGNIENKKVFALVGSGNNGGDALVALTILANHHWDTCAYLVRKRDAKDPILSRYLDANGQIINHEDDSNYSRLTDLLRNCAICLDGVLGTGIKLPLRGEIAKVLNYVKDFVLGNKHAFRVVAVDCPSGVDCDTGATADETIPAEITISMAGMKRGMIRFPAAAVSGDIRFVSIGNIENLDTYKDNKKIILSHDVVKQYIPIRPPDSHKGTFGTAFIIAGSVNYTGAALLAGVAAYRSGVGLVTMAIPEILHPALAGQFPESTWVLLPHELGVISADAVQVVSENIDRSTALLLGPGFGLEDTTKDFIRRFLTVKGEQKKGKLGFVQEKPGKFASQTLTVPIVVDADGLKLLSQIPDWYQLIQSEAILTPHPGEMSVMTGITTKEIQENRIGIAQKYSKDWRHVIVLKGAYTVIASPEGRIAVVPIASAALARAGTGDVLAGLIVGLRAQGVPAFEAACAGAWIHANAGLLAAKKLGTSASVIASDVLDAIPEIMAEFV